MKRLLWLAGLIGLLLGVLSAAAQGIERPVLEPVNAPNVVGLRQWTARDWGVYALAWAPDGTTLATGLYMGGVTLWDAETGAPLGTLAGVETTTVNSLAWSPDGAWLLGGLHEGRAVVWDAASGALRDSLPTADQIVVGVAWSPDGARLAAATIGGSVFVWDAAALSQPPLVLAAHGWTAAAVAFSPDGARLVSAGYDNAVRAWVVASGQRVLDLPTATGMQSVAWSPDGRQIVAGSWDGTLLLWDATDGRLLTRLYGHAPGEMGGNLGVIGVAYHPDGRLLASVSGDGTLRLWDPAAGEALVALGGQTTGRYGLHSVAWSPDGTLLATGADPGSVRVWGLPLLAPGAAAEVHVLLDDRLNVRAEPRIDTNLLARLEDGTRVTILAGPIEADGYRWWQLQTADEIAGWAVERADDLLTLRPVLPATTYPTPDPASGAEVAYPTPSPPPPTPTAGR